MDFDTEETFYLVQVKIVVGTKYALDELEDDLVVGQMKRCSIRS
jgi:hypothetical protein